MPNANTTNTLGRNKRSGSLYQPIQGSKTRTRQDPLLEQLDLMVMDTVVETEMGCLERLATKMKDVSDEICFVSRYEVANKGNTQCWTGTTLGRSVFKPYSQYVAQTKGRALVSVL